MCDFRKIFKYGNKKQFFAIVSLLALLAAAIGFVIYQSAQKRVNITKEFTVNVPPTVLYTTLDSKHHLTEWNDILSEHLDSIGLDKVYLSHGKKKMEIITTEREEYTQLSKEVFLSKSGNRIFYSEWHFIPIQDTVTKVRVHFKGECPFVSIFNLSIKKEIDSCMNNLMENLQDFLETKKKSIRFTVHDQYKIIPGTPYLYQEFPYTLDFFNIFNEHSPSLILYTFSKNIYNREFKPFLLFYFDRKGNQILIKKFRAASPLSRIPEKIDKKYKLDTLQPGSYFCVGFNGNYSWLKYNIIKTSKMIPDTVPLDDSRPFMVRFIKGHSSSPNPEEWLTEIYYPVKK